MHMIPNALTNALLVLLPKVSCAADALVSLILWLIKPKMDVFVHLAIKWWMVFVPVQLQTLIALVVRVCLGLLVHLTLAHLTLAHLTLVLFQHQRPQRQQLKYLRWLPHPQVTQILINHSLTLFPKLCLWSRPPQLLLPPQRQQLQQIIPQVMLSKRKVLRVAFSFQILIGQDIDVPAKWDIDSNFQQGTAKD